MGNGTKIMGAGLAQLGDGQPSLDQNGANVAGAKLGTAQVESNKEFTSLKNFLENAERYDKAKVIVTDKSDASGEDSIFISIGNRGKEFKQNEVVELEKYFIEFMRDPESCGIPRYKKTTTENGATTTVVEMVSPFIIEWVDEQ